ncbi:MAG: NAD(P)/FAD-dependent oxidoreductase [Caulobacteraceae bacterium]
MSKPGGGDTGPDYDAVIIGAGFAGLYAIHKLRSLGFHVIALEKADDVGGVWYWNRYPGARCDCESYYYSYSFSSALQQEWDWSLRYSEQPEILNYLRHVADRFDLRPHIRFSAAVESATFDEKAQLWRVRTGDGVSVASRFLISAAGCLSQIHRPDIPGLDKFAGQTWWTAAWPHGGVDFTGRRVGVIGAGASAVQAIPRIAKQAMHVTVFQRTANWVLPARNVATTAEFNAWVKDHYDDIRDACANSAGAVPFEPPEKSALEVSDDQRRTTYEALWKEGGMRFFTAFTDLFTSSLANETAQAFVRDHIRRIVIDPATAEKLVPTDHPIGVKRPPLEDDYYATFNRQNVTLVDIRQSPIAAVESSGVVTAEGSYAMDDLVLATGFDAMSGALLAIDVRGRGGIRLCDRWGEGPRSYLGLAIAGFPNLFTVTGPLSPSVLANMPTAIEQHVDWIACCLDAMRQRGDQVIEATPAAEDAWVRHTADVMSHTLYSRSHSWYFGSNIPGKARRFGVYVGGFSSYREKCEDVAEANYEGFHFGVPASRAVARSAQD